MKKQFKIAILFGTRKRQPLAAFFVSEILYNYFGWDFIYEELAHKKFPYDYDTLNKSESDFYVGISNCNTGEAEFVKVNNLSKKGFRSVLAASGSLPLIAPIVKYNNNEYLDGGLTESIPFEHALNNNADRVIVVLTRNLEYRKEPLKHKSIFKFYYRKHPKVYEMMVNRAEIYNKSLQKLNELEKLGKAFVIRPQEKLIVDRLESNPQKTAKVYHDAFEYGNNILPDMLDWLK